MFPEVVQRHLFIISSYTGYTKNSLVSNSLVMRGGITNHLLISYSLNNISAKNYQNRLMCVEVIVCNTSVIFRHSVVRSNIAVRFSVPSLYTEIVMLSTLKVT